MLETIYSQSVVAFLSSILPHLARQCIITRLSLIRINQVKQLLLGNMPSGTRETKGRILWRHAKEKVMKQVEFSMSLRKLRDNSDGNLTLDPKRLKLICRLGSKGYSPALHP